MTHPKPTGSRFVEANLLNPPPKSVVSGLRLTFIKEYAQKIGLQAAEKSLKFDEAFEPKYAVFYRQHPFQTPPDFVDSLNQMLHDSDFKQLFDLN